MTNDETPGTPATGETVRPDATALKALAHPLRIQIVDALSSFGPSTASGLAERLGESSGSTSYHLRQLEKHGFVREDASRGSARERWWERTPGPIHIAPSDFEPQSAGRSASTIVTREFQRNRDAALQAYTDYGIDELSTEWQEAGTVATFHIPLTAEQLAALTRELEAVLDGYVAQYRGQRVAGSRPVQIQLNAFPLMGGTVVGEEAATTHAKSVSGAGKTETHERRKS